MAYVNLGNSGVQVSRIALGCMSYGDPRRGAHGWTLPEDESRVFIRQALDLGVNFFDTANVYSDGHSEEIVGRALRDYGVRDEVVIATKVHYPMGAGPNRRGLSRKAIMQEIENSLRRLGTDYVDLFIVHRLDPLTPLEETLEALHDVVKAGKARYLGASSMWAWQFATALSMQRYERWAPFVSMQSQYNLLAREDERELIPLCVDRGVGVTPWSPLARGRLVRDWQDRSARYESDLFGQGLYTQDEQSNAAITRAVLEVSERWGATRAQIALAWLAAKPAVTAPVVGATKPHHLTDAIAALDIVLSAEDLAALEAPYTPRRPETF
jgi:aryl-alcohol dehydrogenase-like predicted oxidoreductase